MWLGRIAILCPPVYYGIRRRWADCVLHAIFLLAALGLVWLGLESWVRTPRTFGLLGPTEFEFAGFLWILSLGRVLADARRAIAALLTSLLVVAVLAYLVLNTAQRLPLRARLAADQGTMEALRAAIAAYYREQGVFPERPEPHVQNFGLQCPAFAYAYDRGTGTVRITSTNTTDDCL